MICIDVGMNFFLLMSQLYFSQKLLGKSGMDDTSRVLNNDVPLIKVLQVNEKKRLLDFLQSNTTSDREKLDEIYRQKYPIIFNMLNGGLMNDWDFDFDFDPIEHYHP